MTISERELVRSQIQQKKKKNRTIILIILAVIVVVAAVIIITRLPKKGSSFTTEDGLSIGDPNAPVKVLEFTNFHAATVKTLHSTLLPASSNNTSKPAKFTTQPIHIRGAKTT